MTGLATQVGGETTPSPTTSFQQFTGSGTLGAFNQTPYAVERALLARGLSGAAHVTLRVLWQYAHLAVSRGNVSPDGEAKTFMSQRTLAQERGVSDRTIRNHLTELEACGAIRRTVEVFPDRHKREWKAITWVRPLPRLYAILMEDPDVRAKLGAAKSPRRQQGVVDLAEVRRQRATHPFRTINDVPEDDDMGNERVGNARAIFNAAVNESSRAAAARQGRKPAFARKPAKAPEDEGRIEKKERTQAQQDTAASLNEYLRAAVKNRMDSVVLPPATQKAAAQMKTLLKGYDANTIRKTIDYVVDHWPAVKKRFKLDYSVPTAGMLLGFHTSLIELAVKGEQPKRSGGAAPVDLTPYVGTRDDNDF